MEATLKKKMQSGAILVGTFIKTPAHEVIEVLARSQLEFLLDFADRNYQAAVNATITLRPDRNLTNAAAKVKAAPQPF